MSLYILVFMVYGFLGWIVEVCYVGLIEEKRFYNRGFLHMPLLPIYASGAMAITLFLTPIKSNIVLVYVFGVIVTSLMEFTTSLVMENIFHTRWWDYSNYKYNIGGRVCLRNSLLFGVLSIVVIYGFNPFIIDGLSKLSEHTSAVIADIFMLAFAIDLTYTLRNIYSMPIRDIQIISGKIKAYADGKRKSFEELAHELERRDLHIRDNLRKYTKARNKRRPILIPTIIISVVTVSLGLLSHTVQALLLLAVLIVLIVPIIHHQFKNFKK